MSYFTNKKYNDNLYQIIDPMGVLATLVIGENKALLFDTCYGIESIKEEVRKITNKELIVVNSHGHMDHTCGDYEFEEIYIHKNDETLLMNHNSTLRREKNIKRAYELALIDDSYDKNDYINKKLPKIKFLNLYEIIDLGGIKCEVLPIFGHTRGSICLFIKEMSLMLTSDGTCPFVWMFLEESLPVSQYIKSLEKILSYEFSHFLVGHGALLYEKKMMGRFLKIAKEIDFAKSFKVSFNDFDNFNSFCYTDGTLYGKDSVGIIYDMDKEKRLIL